MEFILENTTLLDVDIDDLGALVEVGTLYTLGSEDISNAKTSEDLALLIASGDLRLVKTETPLTYYTVSEALSHILSGGVQKLPQVAGENKLWVQQTAMPVRDALRTTTVYTSRGDDLSTPTMSEGTEIWLDLAASDTTKSVDLEWSASFGKMWLHEGWVSYKGAGPKDNVSAIVVAGATPMIANPSGTYVIVDTKVVYVGTGNGTIGTHSLGGIPTLVESLAKTGNWNYDADSATPLTPNLSSEGKYNIFTVDKIVENFISKFLITGASAHPIHFSPSQAQEFPPGYKLRIQVENKSGTIFQVWGGLTLYRERQNIA